MQPDRKITQLPEISELDLIAELLRIMCDEHVIDGDAMFDFAVARGLAEHLRANYRIVPREPGQGEHGETYTMVYPPAKQIPAPWARAIWPGLNVITSCGRTRHEPHTLNDGTLCCGWDAEEDHETTQDSAASVLHGQVDFYCDRHQRRVGHKPHDGCPGHPGRHVPAEQLADLPARAGIQL